jgi:TatD DNase family protein
VCVGLGETGLDYYRLNGRSVAEMAWQRERFAVHIRAARVCGLPLVVHTRSASADTLACCATKGRAPCAASSTASPKPRRWPTRRWRWAFYISFSGILTFRNAEELREVARNVPLERCLIETDSPYLAPMPHRGKTNQPAWVAHVAASLAAIKGLDVQTVARATSENFDNLFFARFARPQPGGTDHEVLL